jgi:hypothetical protein
MKYEGDGRYVCPNGCGEFLMGEQALETEPADGQLQRHVPRLWRELTQGTSGTMAQAMAAVATVPLGTADVVGPCQGHGGKGGGGSKGGGKSPARQKLDAWRRRTSPGRFVRSARVGR